MTASRSLCVAAVLVLLLAGCATTPPSDSVRLTAHEADVAGCERLGELVVNNLHEAGIVPEKELAGSESLDRARGPAIDARTLDSLRHWAAKRGGDVVVVTSVKPSAAKGIAFRCRAS